MVSICENVIVRCAQGGETVLLMDAVFADFDAHIDHKNTTLTAIFQLFFRKSLEYNKFTIKKDESLLLILQNVLFLHTYFGLIN